MKNEWFMHSWYLTAAMLESECEEGERIGRDICVREWGKGSPEEKFDNNDNDKLKLVM